MLKKNRFLIRLIDLLIRPLFFIPVLARRASGKPKAHAPGEILVMELWGIGDLAMMSGILQPLKEGYPASRITLLSKESGKVLFSGSGLIDEFVCFDFPWTRFRKKYELLKWDWRGLIRTVSILRKRRFDLILDARGDIRNNLLSFFIRAARSCGYDWTGGGFLLSDCLYSSSRRMHRVEAWFGLLRHLEIPVAEERTELKLSAEDDRAAADFFATNNIREGELVVGIHPGAGIKSRCWELRNFAELAAHIRDKFHSRIMVFIEPEGYPGEFPIKGEFVKVKGSLRQMAAIIKRLDLLVCNDSGAMHIATAVGTKTISVFGPGDVSRIGPYGRGHQVVMDRHIGCRPCFDRCRYTKPVCLENVSIESAIKAAESALAQAPAAQKEERL